IALAALGCQEAPSEMDPGPTSTTAPGFVQLYDRYFQPTCTASACHDGERGIAGLTFADPRTAYTQLVGAAVVNGAANTDGLLRVDPGDPTNSFLLWKLNHSNTELGEQGYGAAMPLAADALAGPALVEAIRSWIEAGAPYRGLDDFEVDSRPSVSSYIDCTATDEAGMRACFPANTDPALFVRYFTPPITVPAHSDSTFCTYLDVTTDETLYFRATHGRQMRGGHHIAVFYANMPSDNHEPHVCTNAEMTNYMFAAGAGGEGGQDTNMPPGVALRIEAGRQIVLQSHYINTADTPRTVMDMVDIERTTIEESPTIVDSFALINSEFSVPARARDYVLEKTCRIEEDMDIYLMLGHTHESGILFEIERTPSGTTEPELLYHATDGPLLRDNPQILTWDTPLRFAAGDVLTLRCGWDNTSDTPLEWPSEMCVGLMYYGPGRGWLTCDSGDETPQGRMPGAGCAAPTDTGNSLGVGKYCESSADCRGNGRATFCLAPFDSSSNFCSFIGCMTDADCGENTTCVVQSAGSACVPNMCL
ncbi:MAG: hypothetical protein K1X94_34395, partial [Sandaracinaceae bacterium]|nr:hypothetical protein [Sandaracinaceae bacterium]